MTKGRFVLYTGIILSSVAEATLNLIPDGANKISNALFSVDSGDTVMLTTSGGVYHETKSVQLPSVGLTIMAELSLSALPVLTYNEIRHLRVYHNLFIKGIHQSWDFA